MNSFLKISALSLAAFLVTGCNVYRQVVLPTPYYPQSNTPAATEQLQEQNPQQGTQGFAPAQTGQVNQVQNAIVQRIAFPEAEYASIARQGSGRVVGHIYLTGATGSKIYGKQTRLYLNPVTSYSTQWFNKSYLGGAKMSKVDSRLFNYLKFTTSDSNGKFEFLNVPSGSYYLIGVVKCGAACGYDRVKNIRIAKKISVFGSNIKSVDLTKEVK